MTSGMREMLSSVIASRIDTAVGRAGEDPEYRTVCKRQDAAKNERDRLFERFSAEEKAVLRNYEEDETHKGTLEIRETYLQGLRDCFTLLSALSGAQGGGKR